MGGRVTVSRDEVSRVADLAELAVADGELPQLVEQFNRILDFVAQLESVAVPADPPAPVVGPPRTPLREDVVTTVPLARPPGDLAPEFASGFFLVPRRGTMEEA
jgi:aspartyl-tRNA(Asn)/glutamyl-tRNA(Gln) amidotransferase subunit C